MIKVNRLSKSYGEQVLFDGVSFSMTRGERLGVVGRNGHGKTTLFKIILGQEEPDGGDISLPKNYRVGHLSQHIRFSEDTVIKEACLSLPRHEDGIDETYRAAAILMGLGVSEEQFGLHPSELSGGFQIRLNLAKVLLSDPDLLLLDEPTNYLDIVSMRWLTRFLRDWRKEMMLITHDRGFMDSVTTHTMAIHRRGVRRIEGSTEKLYSQIALDEDVYEKTRLNEEKRRKEAELFINRFRAQATKASAVQSRIKALEKRELLQRLDDIRDLDFEFNSSAFNGKVLLQAKDLSFAFREDEPLIDGLSFSVGKKDRIAVIGKNGRGKTTLLNILAGGLTPSSGTVSPHPDLKPAYFGQTNIERLTLSNTIEEELMQSHPECTRGMARKIAGAMMFSGDAALKKIGVLSGGEKSRVLLGKILIRPANLLLLDEPTNHLDMHSVDSLVEAVSSFDGALIMVTHSEMILNSIANRLIVFDRGSVSLFEGTYQEFLDRVGWAGEAEDPSSGRASNGKGINKKELRRLRAGIISEKTKALSPLKKRISEIEEAIIRLEKDIEDTGASLAAASGTGDSVRISELSMSYHRSKKGIDALFEELHAATLEHDSLSKEFEGRLNGTE